MKKIITSLILLLTIFNVKAASCSIKIEGNNTFTENKVKIEIKVKDVSLLEDGLLGLESKLVYDKDLIELSNVSAKKDYQLLYKDKIVLYKTTGETQDFTILELEFTNKRLDKNKSTIIYFKSILLTNGKEEYPLNDFSFSINNGVEQKEEKKSNKIKNTEEKNDAKNEENVEVKSNNNYLKSITLNTGYLKFNKDILKYNISVKYENSTITIKAESEDDKALVSGLGIFDLKVGENDFSIEVKAEDGSIKEYKLVITREEKVKEEQKENIEIEEKTNKSWVYVVIVLIVIAIIILINYMRKDKNKVSF